MRITQAKTEFAGEGFPFLRLVASFGLFKIWPRIALVFLTLAVLHPAGAQSLDQSWTVAVNGQTVQVNSNGTFVIPNVSAADQFGLGGPGTAPDFLSDDFVR